MHGYRRRPICRDHDALLTDDGPVLSCAVDPGDGVRQNQTARKRGGIERYGRIDPGEFEEGVQSSTGLDIAEDDERHRHQALRRRSRDTSRLPDLKAEVELVAPRKRFGRRDAR